MKKKDTEKTQKTFLELLNEAPKMTQKQLVNFTLKYLKGKVK